MTVANIIALNFKLISTCFFMQDGETALIVAASHGHKSVVQVLLKFNSDLTIISGKVIVSVTYFPISNRCLELPIPASIQTSRTALEEAIYRGHIETSELLVEASSRAKVNVSI